MRHLNISLYNFFTVGNKRLTCVVCVETNMGLLLTCAVMPSIGAIGRVQHYFCCPPIFVCLPSLTFLIITCFKNGTTTVWVYIYFLFMFLVCLIAHAFFFPAIVQNSIYCYYKAYM